MYRSLLLALACVLAVAITFAVGATGLVAACIGFPLGYAAMSIGRRLDT